MSVIFDAMLILELSDRETIEAMNKVLYFADAERHQQFNKVDMSSAGGTKSFCTDVYAAAFNHFTPIDVEDAVVAAPWRQPATVLYICDLGDYYHGDYEEDDPKLTHRTVSEIRSLRGLPPGGEPDGF